MKIYDFEKDNKLICLFRNIKFFLSKDEVGWYLLVLDKGRTLASGYMDIYKDTHLKDAMIQACYEIGIEPPKQWHSKFSED